MKTKDIEEAIKRAGTKFKLFEDKQFCGPLADMLNKCKLYRTDAIYNEQYRYIKEIIWDDEYQEKYGITRKGYERFKDDHPGSISFGGKISLRSVTNNGTVKYFTQEKKEYNTSLSEMINIYEESKDKMYEILNVKDINTFDYWFDDYTDFSFHCPNVIIDNIKELEDIINKYNTDDKFKTFIDKIKG